MTWLHVGSLASAVTKLRSFFSGIYRLFVGRGNALQNFNSARACLMQRCG